MFILLFLMYDLKMGILTLVWILYPHRALFSCWAALLKLRVQHENLWPQVGVCGSGHLQWWLSFSKC